MAERKGTKRGKKEPATTDPDASGRPSRWLLILLILLGVLLLATGGAAAYYFLVHKPAQELAALAADPEGRSAPLVPAQYYLLDPITANIHSTGRVRFLRVHLALATREAGVLAAVERHLPLILNELNSELSTQNYETLNTAEGKEGLRASLGERIRMALMKVGEPAGLDDVLFNEFVMQ